ncbi:trypco2 family protein [Streptomyces luteocolor]|uniref:trypco2 family protein n=1 Tax=Streptomyces luteocolor TaxID=285500 RepID=UPI000AA41DD9|nr:trypco2 family protein [Streptomyces luteocolor]
MELAEMIRALRTELNEAVADGADQPVQFELGPVEIEATVAAQRTAGGHGKIRFWVLEGGADAAHTSARTQRITLTLQPKVRTSKGVLTTAYVAGEEVDGER